MRQLKITKSITNRESASLDKYLQEIGREELVSPEEEVELAQKIRQGDQAALEKLTRANLRFVVSVAKQYQNQGLSLPDLINEATSDSSRPPRSSTRPEDSSSSATPCGGYARVFFRLSQSSPVSSGSPSTRWAPSTR